MASGQRSGAHSRNPSNVAVPPRTGSRASQKPSKQPAEPEVHYTLLVRLPFARGDFVDPPQVNWDAAKDQALWEHISRSSKTSDLDWQDLANTFDVPHAFLLQQAAWLYERHLSHVRAQMRKVAPAIAHTPSPGPSTSGSSTVVGGLPMKRLGSGGGSRAQSSLSGRQQEPAVKRMSLVEASGQRPTGLSRNPSTATVTQSRHVRGSEAAAPPSPRQAGARPLRASYAQPVEGRRSSELRRQTQAGVTKEATSPAKTSPASSDSEESSSEDEQPVPTGVRASQIMRRGPAWLKSQKQKLGTVDDESPEREGEDDDDDDLPFAAATKPTQRLEATGRLSTTQKQKQKEPAQVQARLQRAPPADPVPSSSKAPRDAAKFRKDSMPDPHTARKPSADLSSAASTSSASSLPQRDGPSEGTSRKASALSPQHRAQLAKLSPRGKQEGSEGAPSMGSSFSDLDDASISQSALEEALLSKMQHGAASRVSNFSTALRSKYLH